MIKFQNVKKAYGKNLVLNIEDLVVERGECLGIVGNNGAGKTTMLSLILDLIQATEGHITSKDIDVSTSEKWKQFTGSYLDEDFLIPFLTPVEYMDFVGKLHGIATGAIDSFLEENEQFYEPSLFVEHKLIRNLSKGNKNKVGILGALLGNPEILLLDEPFASIDPTSQHWLTDKLKALNKAGMTQLISSHDIRHVTEISTRIIIIENGVIVKDMKRDEGSYEELTAYFKARIPPPVQVVRRRSRR